MRRSFQLLAGIGALGLVASAASAGTLKQADLIVTLNGATATFHRAVADGLAGSSTASGASLAAGSAFAGLTTTAPITPITNAAVTRVLFALGSNGKIQATGGGVSVTAPLAGTGKVKNPYATLVTVPLAIGAGTPGNPHVQTVVQNIPYVGSVFVTLSATGWHVGTVTATGLTTGGQALSNVSAHGSFSLDSKGGGTLTLVTLSRITVSGILVKRTAEPTYLTLTYVPEPGSLLLLGAAALAALAAGRRRMG